MVARGELPKTAQDARIDRLCLYYRLACRLGPGGDHYPALGVMHFWQGSRSLFAIINLSPLNDWCKILVVPGEPPIATFL